jgi:tetratricopeptide (TPR) repeat protein
MTDDLYERYKEALRVGHVAVLRGALEEALEAYRTAASIAPSRALPHTSLGGVLLRLGHLEEALVEYAAAVARSPHDEGALLGQAEALTMAGQRVDAAQALDHVSEIQEAAGRLPEAADTLRRALELEDVPERGRHQRGLLREIRLSAGDQAAEQLLARALRLRDEPSAEAGEAPAFGVATTLAARMNAASIAPPIHDATAQPDWAPAPAEANVPAYNVEVAQNGEALEWPAADFAQRRRELEPPEMPAISVERAATSELESGPGLEANAAPSSETFGTVETAESVVEAGESKVPEPVELAVSALSASPASLQSGLAPASIQPILAAVGVMEGEFDPAAIPGLVGESQHQPTGDELLAAAEAADLVGDNAALRSLLVWTARAYAREGRFEAGLDAAHRLLQRGPSDVDAHLVLVELYVSRDWNALAAEKLALLGRLADLDNDEPTKQRLCAVASRVFPSDARLGALCA